MPNPPPKQPRPGGPQTLWNEIAAATERRDGQAVISCEGLFAELVAALQTLKLSALYGVRVSLPDRHVPPFAFEGHGLALLLKDPMRPSGRRVRLLAPGVK